jgi:hypothetical protein
MGPITFLCYSCQQPLKVGGDKAGQKVKCFKCGTILTVPVASTVPPVPPASVPKVPPALPPPAALPASAAIKPSQTPMPPGVLMAQLAEEPVPAAVPYVRDDPPVKAELAPAADDQRDPERRRRRRDRDEEDDYDDFDRPVRTISLRSSWRKVRMGLLLIFIGACVYAGGYGLAELGVLLRMCFGFSRPQNLGDWIAMSPAFSSASALYRLGLFVVFGATITSIVGYVFCLFTPNRYSSLGLAIAILATAGVGLLLFMPFRMAGRTFFFVSVFDGPFLDDMWFGALHRITLMQWSPGGFIVDLLVDGCMLAPFILVPLYLRALARARKERAHAERCWHLMVFSACAIGYNLLWPLVAMPFAASSSNAVLAVIYLLYYINVGLFIGMLVWFIRTLAEARAAFER